MHGSICQPDAPVCLLGMFDLPIQISSSHAHGWLKCFCTCNSAYLTRLHTLLSCIPVLVHTLLGHTYVLMLVLWSFTVCHRLRPQSTMQAWVTERYSRASPERSICTKDKTLAVQQEQCRHQHDLCCFNITRAYLLVSDPVARNKSLQEASFSALVPLFHFLDMCAL